VHESGSIWPDDVLEHWLGVEPFVHLDPIVELQDRFVSLDCPPPPLVGELLLIAVVAVCESNSELVLVATRNESLINKACVEVKWERIVVLRREVYQTEEIESLLAQFRFRGLLNLFRVRGGLAIRGDRGRWRLRRRFAIKLLVRLPIEEQLLIIRQKRKCSRRPNK
jgi:hypothetical protein